MGFVQDFKAFAVKGNVVDMAVGVVIGGAFGKIVTSMVNDIVMPLVGLATGGTDFSDRWLALSRGDYASIAEAHAAGLAEVGKHGVAALKYGSLVQTIIDFLIVALCIFIAIRQIAKLSPKPEPAK